MTRERRIDALSALTVIAIAGIAFAAARREPPPLYDPLGPGSAPAAVAVVLGLLGALLLARTLLGSRVGQSQQSLILGLDGAAQDYALRPGLAAFAFAATLAYVGALQAGLPFLWSTIAFLAALGAAMSDRSPRQLALAVAVALLGALAVDALFRRLLLVQLT